MFLPGNRYISVVDVSFLDGFFTHVLSEMLRLIGTGLRVLRYSQMAGKNSDIKKNVSVPSFRYSFATHLLESGTYLRYIQGLPGHKNSKTTEIYTHTSNKNIGNIKSPLDSL